MGRPVLFRQRRVGRDGHAFEMLKFRTMRGTPDAVGEADSHWAALILAGTSVEPNEVVAAPKAEDRRTLVGALLRRLSLDELPQLWNVVRGDMSLIGPRPERTAYVEQFERAVYRYPDRHRVKSGLTGWAQVHGLRGETSLEDRIEWDNYYIENWSPMLDLKIVLMTLTVVLRRNGA
jgi:lipopolysaccharide/colanic/teichoic acid biosynthesis glycosyltransferase